MGVVGSLPSENRSDSIAFKEEPVIDEQYTDDTSVSYEIIPNTDIKNDVTTSSPGETSADLNNNKPKRYKVVSYGPINVRVCLDETVTLKTGRRSKFVKLEGEDAKRRERRRARNRAAAKKLKEKRIELEARLTNEIKQLEERANKLQLELNNLQSYKEFLERRCHEFVLTREYFLNNRSAYLMHLESLLAYHPESVDWRTRYDD